MKRIYFEAPGLAGMGGGCLGNLSNRSPVCDGLSCADWLFSEDSELRPMYFAWRWGGSVGIAGGSRGGGGGRQAGGAVSMLKECWTVFLVIWKFSWGKSSGEDCMLDDDERKSVEFVRETIWVSSFCSVKSGKENTECWWLLDDLRREWKLFS